MTTPTHAHPCNVDAARPADGWMARVGHAIADAHRRGYVSRHELEIRLLADIDAPQAAPTTDELRDAWRLWFGGDVTRNL